MLKNGTLLKVSPDLIRALKNALDIHYLPLIQQASRRQRRQLLNDDVEPSTVTAEYNGYFKVIWDNVVDENGKVTQRRVKVINGADPTSDIAGYTDIVHSVPVSTVDVPPDLGYGSLHLCGRYTSEKGYFVEFVFDPHFPDEKYGNYVIAYIGSDKTSIYQVWTGGAIYFSERYIV